MSTTFTTPATRLVRCDYPVSFAFRLPLCPFPSSFFFSFVFLFCRLLNYSRPPPLSHKAESGSFTFGGVSVTAGGSGDDDSDDDDDDGDDDGDDSSGGDGTSPGSDEAVEAATATT